MSHPQAAKQHQRGQNCLLAAGTGSPSRAVTTRLLCLCTQAREKSYKEVVQRSWSIQQALTEAPPHFSTLSPSTHRRWGCAGMCTRCTHSPQHFAASRRSWPKPYQSLPRRSQDHRPYHDWPDETTKPERGEGQQRRKCDLLPTAGQSVHIIHQCVTQ